MDYEDIVYEVRGATAWITIDRAAKMNAFRGRTCDELIHALQRAGYDRAIGAIVLAGAGDKAFCTPTRDTWRSPPAWRAAASAGRSAPDTGRTAVVAWPPWR